MLLVRLPVDSGLKVRQQTLQDLQHTPDTSRCKCVQHGMVNVTSGHRLRHHIGYLCFKLLL
jgi:hypothetical protein